MIKKIEIAILSVILLLVGFFATYKLSESPSVWYDEGFYVQIASNLSTYGKYGLQLQPGEIEPVSKLVTVGYPLIYPLALAFKVFGNTITVARGTMVLFILGFVLASYFLARRLFGASYALGAVALLVTFAPLYGNGKSALGEVPGLFFLILSLLSLERSVSADRKSSLGIIFAGLFAGLCVSTKPIFIIFVPAIALAIFINWRSRRLSLPKIFLGVLSASVPIIIWFYVQFGFSEKLTSILSFYANPFQEKNIYSVVFENLKHFVSDSGPIYLLIIMFVWLLSIIISRRKKMQISATEVASFTFSLLISMAYLKTNGWYRFIFPAQIISLIYFPRSLSACSEFISEKLKYPVFSRVAKSFWIIPVISFAALGTYQIMFSSWVAEAYKSDKTAFWENYFRNIPREKTLFFYNVPEVAALDFGAKYYQYIAPAGWEIGASGLKMIDLGVPDSIVLRTDAFEGNENRFSKYRSQMKAYKYTILIKK